MLKRRLLASAALCPFVLSIVVSDLAQAQVVTRQTLSKYNNANIFPNSQGLVTPSIVNSMFNQTFNGMGVLGDTNAWGQLNTFSVSPPASLLAPGGLSNPLSAYVLVPSDNATSTTTPGQHIPTALDVEMHSGGSNINDGRNALASYFELTSPTSMANGYRFYTSGNFFSDIASNDNGTSGVPAGSVDGIGVVSRIRSAATNWSSLLGVEVNTAADAGSSVLTKAGLAVLPWPEDAVHGSLVDAMVWMSAGVGAVGFYNAIQIDAAAGAFPIPSIGTIFKVIGGTVATGIDMGSTTITGNFAQWGGSSQWWLAGDGGASLRAINNLVYASGYASVSAAESAAATAGSALVFSPRAYDASGVTFTTPVVLQPGAVLNCATAQFSFTNSVSAPRNTIFGSACSPTFSGGHAQSEIYPEWKGAVADATGATGVGTDNCVPFTWAFGLSNVIVNIRPGQYRWACDTPVGAHTTISGGGHANTILWFDEPTGATDAFGVNVGNITAVSAQAVFRDFWALPTIGSTARTAGALVHITNSYDVRFDNVELGYFSPTPKLSFDNVLVDCMSGTNAQSPQEIRFNNVIFNSPSRDNIRLSCPVAGMSIADVYISPHSYITEAGNAGLDMLGAVGWVEGAQVNWDQNVYAILGNGAGYSSFADVLNFQGGHFESAFSVHDVYLTGYNTVNINGGNQFIGAGDGITCIGCGGVDTSANSYSATAGLQIAGSTGWTDEGSQWSNFNTARTAMVVVSANGATAAAGLKLGGEHIGPGNVPFVNFSGSSHPATNVKISVEAPESLCWTGTNVDLTTFSADCDSPTSQNGMTKTGGFIDPTPTSGLQGNMYFDPVLGWRYHANGAAGSEFFNSDLSSTGTRHAIEYYLSGVNASGPGAAASPFLAGWISATGVFDWLGAMVMTTLNMSAIPTSAGSGGLYVCVDTSGNTYKKSACP